MRVYARLSSWLHSFAALRLNKKRPPVRAGGRGESYNNTLALGWVQDAEGAASTGLDEHECISATGNISKRFLYIGGCLYRFAVYLSNDVTRLQSCVVGCAAGNYSLNYRSIDVVTKLKLLANVWRQIGQEQRRSLNEAT